MNAPFIIRYLGDYAVKFHTNVNGKVYSLVADADATRFADAEQAVQTALAHGIKPAHIALRAAPESEVAA